MVFEMFTILLLLLLAHTSLSEVYDLTADDLFESMIGEVNKYQKKIDPPKSFKKVRSFLDNSLARSEALANKIKILNGTHIRMTVTSTKRTTEQQTVNSTQEEPQNVNIKELKQRMKKLQVNQMLATHTSPIPDFSNDADNPIHVTRRFQTIVKDVRRTFKPDLRQLYFFSVENKPRLRREKFRTIALMEQFIYAARYKMPYLQLLRKKYNYHLRYKIGYCFALLRNLQQQQVILYSALDRYHKQFTNLMIHMKLYEKVVRLDVDIKDLCFLIRRMNYQMKIEETPDYYGDINLLNSTETTINPVTD